MKLHLVVTAAVAGLCSHAAFADPEAGFWQQPEQKILHTSDSSAPCGADRKSERAGRDNARVYVVTREQIGSEIADAIRDGDWYVVYVGDYGRKGNETERLHDSDRPAAAGRTVDGVRPDPGHAVPTDPAQPGGGSHDYWQPPFGE